MTAPTAEEELLAGQLTPEELTQLEDGLRRVAAEQASIGLYDLADAHWVESQGSGRHVLVLGQVQGVLDAAAGRFTPDDPEAARLLLAQRLSTDQGAATFQVAGEPRPVDWDTVELDGEADGRLLMHALTVPAEDGAVWRIGLTGPLAGPLEADTGAAERVDGGAVEPDLDAGPSEEEAEEAADGFDEQAGDAATSGSVEVDTGYDADYMSQYYSGDLLAYGGRSYDVDWTTWRPDQVTEQGLVGSEVRATTPAGGDFELYVWFDPAEGPAVVRSVELAAPDEDLLTEPYHGVTAAFLSENYDGYPFPYGGREYLVDWGSWVPDQETEDGLVGGEVSASGVDGGEYAQYVWYDPDSGPRIVRSDELTPPPVPEPSSDEPEVEDGPAEQADEVLTEADARAEFDDVLSQQLADAWAGRGRTLVDVSGKAYDVSGWLDGEFDCVLQFTGHDGAFYYARLGAATAGDDPRPVTCQLRIQDPQTVWVEAEEARL